MNHESFRAELIRRQGTTLGRDFARRLEISESYWSMIRRRERPLTLAVIERAIREFPDLAQLLVTHLLSESRDDGGVPRALPSGPRLGRFELKRLLVNGSLAAMLTFGIFLVETGLLGTGQSPNVVYAEQPPCKPGKTLVVNRNGKYHCVSINSSQG